MDIMLLYFARSWRSTWLVVHFDYRGTYWLCYRELDTIKIVYILLRRSLLVAGLSSWHLAWSRLVLLGDDEAER